MTQETVDMVVYAYCDGCQEFIGDYELVVRKSIIKNSVTVDVRNINIEHISLPWEYIRDSYTPKEKAKIIISLLEQIIENGDQWLQDEADYHGDKLAEKGDNDYKCKLEND